MESMPSVKIHLDRAERFLDSAGDLLLKLRAEADKNAARISMSEFRKLKSQMKEIVTPYD